MRPHYVSLTLTGLGEHLEVWYVAPRITEQGTSVVRITDKSLTVTSLVGLSSLNRASEPYLRYRPSTQLRIQIKLEGHTDLGPLTLLLILSWVQSAITDTFEKLNDVSF
jgi:hypothetical protein